MGRRWERKPSGLLIPPAPRICRPRACDLVGFDDFTMGAAPSGGQLFFASVNWTVPDDVYLARLLAVGGGAGGTYNSAGGGSGWVVTATVSVTPGQVLAISIGTGGAPGGEGSNFSGPGGDTMIGSLLTAPGGSRAGYFPPNPTGGASGGSGSGGGGGNGARGGDGGAAGGNGTAGDQGGAGGVGGHFAADLATLFSRAVFTPGLGGVGMAITYYLGPSGGGGGVVINGAAPTARGGVWGTTNGVGYGAGGGGHHDTGGASNYGYDGFAYAEWG